MNRYTKNLSRLEFAVTYACTGDCKHCSEAHHREQKGSIEATAAAKAVRELANVRSVSSVMTFGGEPMLCADAVCAIHSAAAQAGIPKRQIITNGFFSRNIDKIAAAAKSLAEAGVNDVLLSADAFHQETIPIEPVRQFALQLVRQGVPVRVQPAWLVSRDDDNPYNQRTREIIAGFEAMGISQSEGNVIFPSGNALKYLGEYFDADREYSSPYQENAEDIHTVCVSPNGDVLCGNIYRESIADIIESYRPHAAERK